MRYFRWLLIFLLLAIPNLAHSTQPLDVIRSRIDQVMNLLKDPRYQDSAQKGLQREKMWEVIGQVFDFQEMGKRALARSWRKFNSEEREAFSKLYSELLSNTYIDKIQRGYRDEEVTYLGQEMVSETKALVKTKVLRQGVQIPVSYRLFKRDETWKVYDVNIEGVSLVKNYRAQFSKILLKRPPSHLIDLLRKKVDRMEKERASSE